MIVFIETTITRFQDLPIVLQVLNDNNIIFDVEKENNQFKLKIKIENNFILTLPIKTLIQSQETYKNLGALASYFNFAITNNIENKEVLVDFNAVI